MQHVFHSPEEYSFEKVGHKGKILDTKSSSDRVEFIIIEVEGSGANLKEKTCIFSYFILDGSGSFEIGDDMEECLKGDLVIIPKDIAFKYTGKMKMLLVSTPWWFPEQEETL